VFFCFVFVFCTYTERLHDIFSFDEQMENIKGKSKQSKAVPLHAMVALGGEEI
jgi:hypothetical protein